MTIVEGSYLAFALGAGAVFLVLPTRNAILLVFLGGWIVLPVGVYPSGVMTGDVAWWEITGLAVPSNMLVTKAWVAPCAALLWALMADPGRLRGLRPGLPDLPVLAWCLWPLLAGTLSGPADPAPLLASTYLLGTWGATWALGRIWFCDDAGRVLLLKGLALGTVACLPIVLAEVANGPWLYSALLHPHPFEGIGAGRPVGHRPLGFFEEGNQFGIWTALGALGAVWVAATPGSTRMRGTWILLALMAVAIGVVHQSRGAILSLLIGGVLLLLWHRRAVPVLLAGAGVLALLLIAGLYSGRLVAVLQSSGLLHPEALARGSDMARQMRALAQQFGLGTLGYRFWQDMHTLPAMLDHPILGTGVWDWWRAAQMRPIGAWQLLAGQFGFPAAAIALSVGLMPAVRGLWRQRRRPVWRPGAAAVPLALIVVLAVLDGFLNAGIFFPAFLAAGALAGARPACRAATGCDSGGRSEGTAAP